MSEFINYNGDTIELPEGTDIDMLRDVQDCELKILTELERVCKKINIHYSLAGGTLIGAARHADFVPWDDDIDVDIKLPEYKKLVSVIRDELSSDFEFVDYNEFGEYFCDFIPRIFYKKSNTINSFSTNGTTENICKDERMNRVFIELYPLCETKKGLVVHSQILFTKVLYGLCMGHRAQKKDITNYSLSEKISSSILSSVGSKIPLKTLYSAYEKNASRITDGKGNAYFKPSVPLPVQEKNIFDKKWFSSYTELTIRSKTVMVPQGWKDMLNTLYSNWSSLPPVESRHPDHFDLKKIKIW